MIRASVSCSEPFRVSVGSEFHCWLKSDCSIFCNFAVLRNRQYHIICLFTLCFIALYYFTTGYENRGISSEQTCGFSSLRYLCGQADDKAAQDSHYSHNDEPRKDI